MDKVQFEAELIKGHKGVTVVLVPFDPEQKWSLKPVRLEGRRHGWLVAGTANGVRFDGYIGERWNRFSIIFDSALRTAVRGTVADRQKMSIEPASSARVLARAVEQSKVTTARKIVRPDAIDPAKDAIYPAPMRVRFGLARSPGCSVGPAVPPRLSESAWVRGR